MATLLSLTTCAPFGAMAADALLPTPIAHLIRHERYAEARALTDAAIASAQVRRAEAPSVFCAALDRGMRIDFFDADSVTAADLVTRFDRARTCWAELPGTDETSARVAWSDARLAAAAFIANDAVRGRVLRASSAPLIERYRVRLGMIDYAIALRALASAAVLDSDFAAALELIERAHGALRGHAPATELVRSQIVVFEAFALGRMGRFAEAENAGSAALTLALRGFGEPSLAHLGALTELAQVQYFAQHYEVARKTAERAVTEARSIGADAQTNLARILVTLGNCARRVGDYAHARAALTEAIALRRTSVRVTQFNLDSALNQLAVVESESGHCDAAIPLLREALAIEGTRVGADSDRAIVKLDNLAHCERESGRLGEARADALHALAIAEKVHDGKRPDLANSLLDLAQIELAERDYAGATVRLERALGLLPGDPELFAQTRIDVERNLARALHGSGDDRAAFAHAEAAEEVRQRLLRRVAAALDEGSGLGFHAKLDGGLDQVLALAAAHDDADWYARAWRLAIGNRLLVTRLTAARLRALRNSARDDAVRALWDDWQNANTRFARARIEADAHLMPDALVAARDALDRSERALFARLPQVADLIEPAPAMARLADSLAAGSTLLAYVTASHDAWEGDRGGTRDVALRMYAFRLDPGTGPHLVDLGAASPIDDAIRAWTRALRDPRTSLEQVATLGTGVRRLIVDPLALPASASRWLIVPAGAVHRVAWLALPFDDATLGERATVPQLLDSERDLLAAPTPHAPSRLLLVGAPPLDPSALRLDDPACMQPLAELAGAARELESLRALWHSLHPAASVSVLVGGEATPHAVRVAAERGGILHFATHAFAADSACLANFIATRSVRLTSSPARPAAADANQGANDRGLSGLVLAPDAARMGAAEASDHGILSATEIAALKLDDVDSVTLAACDTGLGPVLPNEGVFGLARAFRVAGARSVVMSLWQIDDGATVELMQRYYRAHLGANADAAAALAGAARETLVARRAAGMSTHPYYWAAFVAVGDMR